MGVLELNLKYYHLQRVSVWNYENVKWTTCRFYAPGDIISADIIGATSPPSGATRAVWTYYGLNQIHLADNSPRHLKDGRAGTTILYYLGIRVYSQTRSLSAMSMGQMKLLEYGQRCRIRQGRRTIVVVLANLRGDAGERSF
jgi:hypothetical protein